MKLNCRHLLKLSAMATLSVLAGALGGVLIDEAMGPSSVTAAMLSRFEPGTVPTEATARVANELSAGADAADTPIVAGIRTSGFDSPLEPCPASDTRRLATYVEQGIDGPQLVLITLDRAGWVVGARTIDLTAIE